MSALGAALHEDGHHGHARAQREERRAGRRVRGAAEEGDEDPGAARVLVDQHGDDAVSTERLAHRGDEARIVAHQDLDPGRRPEADDERVEAEVVHAPHDHRDRVADGRRPRREELPVADVPRDRDGAPPPDERRVERLDTLEADVVGPAEDLLEQRQLGERLPGVAEGLAHQAPARREVELREGQPHVGDGEPARRGEQRVRRHAEAAAGGERGRHGERAQRAAEPADRARERRVARAAGRATQPAP